MSDLRDVLITGGTGFIGGHLCHLLRARGYRITILTRNPQEHLAGASEDVRFVSSFDQLEAQTKWYGVINLAGEPLSAGRWNPARKNIYRASRIELTQRLNQWICSLEHSPAVLLSGSAVGWYGHWQDESLDETSDSHGGYAHQLCSDWESAAIEQLPPQTRLVLVRIGIVLGADGGPLPEMLAPAKLGLGGPMGSGRQWWSWIHIYDLTRLLLFLLETDDVSGPVNATAPNPVTQREFASLLGVVLNRPAFLPLPAFIAELALGEFAREILLNGQRVFPVVAQSCGFSFKYPELGPALSDILACD
ncbi:MAG: TIGR01777 family oxidoreductase [Halioglobus sp.]